MNNRKIIQSILDLFHHAEELRMEAFSLDEDVEKAYEEIKPYEGQERFTGEQVELKNWLIEIDDTLSEQMAVLESFKDQLTDLYYKSPLVFGKIAKKQD